MKESRYQKYIPEMYQILFDGNKMRHKVVAQTVANVKNSMGINYFEDID